jgi:predicted phage terminase large subunit-like protein
VASVAAPAVIGWRAREELVRRELARRKLSHFLRYRLHHEGRDAGFLWNYHIDYLAEVLEAVAKRQERRVIINIPPRFLKTELTVETFPAWMIGRDPTPKSSMLSVSFSAKLAEKSSRKTRDIITAPWFKALFGDRNIELDDAQQEKGDWELRYGPQSSPGAWRIAAGVEGTLTGRGADHLVADDIIKPKEAGSDVVRTNACDFLGETLKSRHNDIRHGTMTLIMQRLHEMDPTGYLLEQMKTPGADQYFHVVLPLEGHRAQLYSYGDFFYERKPGELLHEERMGATEIAAMKVAQQNNFEGQYNQNPIKMQGNQFLWKRANLYDGEPPQMTKVIQAWDFALTEEERDEGCYSVCVTAGITRLGQLYILDVWRERRDAAQVADQIIELYRRWRPYRVYGEEGQIKMAIMPFLRRKMADIGVYIPIEGVMPGKQDKAMRATSFEAAWNGGAVYLPKAAGWLTDYRLEVTAFPKSRFKDQVDASAYIGMKYDELRAGELVPLVQTAKPTKRRGGEELQITGDMQRKKAGLAPVPIILPPPPKTPSR